MNCRINEEKVFPSDMVAPLLRKHFVEARLHNDGPDKDVVREVVRLQQELAESYATPFYLVLDPKSGKQLGGTLAGEVSKKAFVRFLEEALADQGELIGLR